MDRSCRLLAAAAAIAIGLLASSPATAETAPGGGGGTKVAGPEQALESTDQAKVRQALEAIAAQKSPRATPAIAKRIKAGLPGPLLGLAIDTLAAIPRGPGSAVLLELAAHRSAQIRVKSIRAAVALGVPGAPRTLIAALDDGSEEVRGAAIDGLVKLRSREALPALFLAFEREVPDADEAVGQLAGQGEVPRIVGYLHDLSFTRVAPLLTTMLTRRDVPAPAKVRLIEGLQGVTSPEVALVLQQVLENAPPAETDPVRRAAQAALDARTEAGDGGPAAQQPAPAGGTP